MFQFPRASFKLLVGCNDAPWRWARCNYNNATLLVAIGLLGARR